MQTQAALARADVQDTLVRWAGRHTLKDFTASAARLVASFDPMALERTAEAQHRERYLHLSHQPDGTYLRGRLDRLAGEALSVALASVRQAPDEDRTRAQADADALVALAERAIAGMAGVKARRTTVDGALLPDPEQDAADARVTGVAARPTVSVLLPAQTLVELRGHRGRTDRSPASAQLDTAEAGWRAVEPAALEDGTPVPMSELARLLCDSEVGRIVLDAEGLPLDLGRTQRLYTGAQRRAVIIRDRVCAWNGCDVPAAFCDVHHIRWWDRDHGPTSVDNGVLLCSHHHRVVHRHDCDIVRLTRPPGRGAPTLGEPVRYEFRRNGRRINAPPDGVEVAAAEAGSAPGCLELEQTRRDVA